MTRVNITFDPKDVVVFDTETTGIGYDAEICQLAIVDYFEVPIFNKLIKPTKPIPPEATAIHGITNELVKDENDLFYYRSFICKNALHEKVVLGYNVTYDIRMLFQSFGINNRNETVSFAPAIIYDVMLFAKEMMHSTKWPKLHEACEFYSIPLPKGAFHGAYYDSIATLRLAKKLQEFVKFL